MAEKIIGGFASPNIARKGQIRGYGLYVTTDRIIGIKGGWKQWSGIFLGDIIGVAGAGLDDASRAIKELEQKKDFEVRKGELQEVRIQRRKKDTPENISMVFLRLVGLCNHQECQSRVYHPSSIWTYRGNSSAERHVHSV